MMLSRTPAYIFEDNSGLLDAHDLDDAYDRLFMRVIRNAQPSDGTDDAFSIYDMGKRSSSRHLDTRHLEKTPLVVLEFGKNDWLGTIHIAQGGQFVSQRMSKWLYKTSRFGGSTLSRKFRSSDGHEYRWLHRGVEGQEWSCVTEEDQVIAYYDLRRPGQMAYRTSGHTFTVEASYISLILELVASLTILRYLDSRQ